MATVEFTIKGLAVCCYKGGEDFWTIVFPTDINHMVKFSYKKLTGEVGSADLAGKSVTITSTDFEPIITYEDPSFSKYVIDLTGDYLHSDGLKSRVTNVRNVSKTILKVPNAVLSSKELRERRLNYVFPFDDPGAISLIKDKADPTKSQIFSKLVGGSINIKPNGKITITITDEQPIDLFEGDAFHIDNDCHHQSTRNDFQMYQDIFENKADPGKRFEMISIKYPNAIETDSFEEKFMTDPPPLICDTARISLTDDLD